jgi:hypothetical protein
VKPENHHQPGAPNELAEMELKEQPETYYAEARQRKGRRKQPPKKLRRKLLVSVTCSTTG